MKMEFYTKSDRHPDDAVYDAKTIITELMKIHEQYFSNLLEDLNLQEEGEGWLFDFIYNSDDDNKLTFTEFLQAHGKRYEDFVSKK